MCQMLCKIRDVIAHAPLDVLLIAAMQVFENNVPEIFLAFQRGQRRRGGRLFALSQPHDRRKLLEFLIEENLLDFHRLFPAVERPNHEFKRNQARLDLLQTIIEIFLQRIRVLLEHVNMCLKRFKERLKIGNLRLKRRQLGLERIELPLKRGQLDLERIELPLKRGQLRLI